MTDREAYDQAIAALKQSAVTQPHAVRRQMMQWAKMYETGIKDDGERNVLIVSIPVFNSDDKEICRAEVMFHVNDGIVNIHPRRMWWDEEAGTYVEGDSNDE